MIISTILLNNLVNTLYSFVKFSTFEKCNLNKKYKLFIWKEDKTFLNKNLLYGIYYLVAANKGGLI